MNTSLGGGCTCRYSSILIAGDLDQCYTLDVNKDMLGYSKRSLCNLSYRIEEPQVLENLFDLFDASTKSSNLHEPIHIASATKF